MFLAMMGFVREKIIARHDPLLLRLHIVLSRDQDACVGFLRSLRSVRLRMTILVFIMGCGGRDGRGRKRYETYFVNMTLMVSRSMWA